MRFPPSKVLASLEVGELRFNWAPLAVAWIVTLAALAAGGGERSFPILLVLLALTSALASPGELIRLPRLLRSDPLPPWFALCTAYVALSALWSPAAWWVPLTKAAFAALCLLAVLLAVRHLATCDERQLNRIARGCVVGLAIALVFLACEYRTRFTLTNLLVGYWPGLVANKFDGQSVPPHFFNRAATATALFFWPVLLIAWHWVGANRRTIAAGVFLAAMLSLLALTESQTAQLAFLLAAAAFALAHLRPRWMPRLAAGGWTVAVVGIVPIAHLLHRLGWHQAAYIPDSFKERVAIWHATAVEVAKHPLLGVGVQADRHSGQVPQIVSDITADHLGWHAHDLFLQIWHELGAFGAALLLGLGLLLLRRIARLAPGVQPFAYATFAAMVGIAAVGYGAWQTWLLACYAWTVILVATGRELGRRTPSPPVL